MLLCSRLSLLLAGLALSVSSTANEAQSEFAGIPTGSGETTIITEHGGGQGVSYEAIEGHAVIEGDITVGALGGASDPAEGRLTTVQYLVRHSTLGKQRSPSVCSANRSKPEHIPGFYSFPNSN